MARSVILVSWNLDSTYQMLPKIFTSPLGRSIPGLECKGKSDKACPTKPIGERLRGYLTSESVRLITDCIFADLWKKLQIS